MIEMDEITEVLDYIEDLSAVVFDLDDTLYSEKEYVRSGYKAVAEMIPQIADAEEKLWCAFEEKKPAINVVLKNAGIYSNELKDRCLNVYRNQKPDIHLYDGALEMLKEIYERGLDIGIIVDGRPEGQRKKISILGLEPIMDEIIITDELGGLEYRKPCGKTFHLMRGMIGNGGYSMMCYVGDNIKKDFIAPEEFGMRCIWFRNKDGLYYRER